jgi:hypothetical protein
VSHPKRLEPFAQNFCSKIHVRMCVNARSWKHKMGPINPAAIIAHQYQLLWEFVCPMRRNHASWLNGTCVMSISPHPPHKSTFHKIQSCFKTCLLWTTAAIPGWGCQLTDDTYKPVRWHWWHACGRAHEWATFCTISKLRVTNKWYWSDKIMSLDLM